MGERKPVVDWILSLGRIHLTVAGVVVATEGDLCRDPGFGRVWTEQDIKAVVKRAARHSEKGGAGR